MPEREGASTVQRLPLPAPSAPPVEAPGPEAAGGGGEAWGSSRGAMLFARLRALDPEAEAADYQLQEQPEAREEWDVEGLMSDIQLAEEELMRP